jgi:predicted phosphodiesterase
VGTTGVLVDEARAERLPDAAPQRRRFLTLRRVLALAAIVAATLGGGYLGLISFDKEDELSVGNVKFSVSPGHKGALDVYVPLVDWGARFESIRLPVRLRVDLRTVDRRSVQRVASGGQLDVRAVRGEARDAIAGYLQALIAVVVLCGGSLGVLTAFAVRGGATPKLRYTIGAALTTAVATGVLLVVLIPPRGPIDEPQYYAYGPDIPRALQAVEAAQRSSRALDQELDAQLVGLARLVTAPANRPAVEGRPRITLASDLHNNVLTLPILERTAGNGPVFFAGDLTDRGTPLETSLVRRVVRTGNPFVFVSGNHDSDSLKRALARDGAIVLTETGRLKPDGSTSGNPVVRAAGLRVAGYSDPFERLSRDDFADRFDNEPDPGQAEAFAAWLRRLRGKVDVVMVHEPQLIEQALRELEQNPPAEPLTIFVGHTHKASLQRLPGVTVLNGGSVGGGGTGNLAEGGGSIGIARFSFQREPSFEPLAADLVQIDPGTGSATARRERLDAEPAPGRGA